MSESSLPLTARRRHFVDAYLVHGNATRAAIAAGYSAASAASIGSELLTMPNVRAAIDARQAERSAELRVRADKALEELARIAFADIEACLEPGPDGVRRLDLSDLTADKLAAIGDVRFDAEGRPKAARFRIAEKRAALVALLRHLPKAPPRMEAAAATPAEEEDFDFEQVYVAPPVRDAAGNEIAPAREVGMMKRGADGRKVYVPFDDAPQESSGNGTYRTSSPVTGEGRGGGAASCAEPASPPYPTLPRKGGGGRSDGVDGPPASQESSGNAAAAESASADPGDPLQAVPAPDAPPARVVGADPRYPGFEDIPGEDPAARLRRLRQYAVEHVAETRAIMAARNREAHRNRVDKGRVRRVREQPESSINPRWWRLSVRPIVKVMREPRRASQESSGNAAAGGGGKSGAQ